MITGEAFIRPSDFEQLKASLVDNNGETYKNGRNLAAGSVRLLDAKTCMERRLMFMPFTVLEGFENLPRKSERLKELSALGFTPCKYVLHCHAIGSAGRIGWMLKWFPRQGYSYRRHRCHLQ